MQQKTAGNAQTLAAYIAGAAGRRLPDQVTDAARLCLADWLAVAIGARDEDAGRIVRETVAGFASSGRSTVIFALPATAALAALANGTLAHCLDFDDTHIPSITHTSAPVWAATLAVGEAVGADEARILSAFVTGFEVATRAGKGLGQAVTSRGLHSTGVWGRLGAASAASALMGLDSARAAHALAVAATQVSGLTASFGTHAKPFHAGKAAMDGVLAAELASRGFEANPGVLDPGGGLDRALIQDGSLKLPEVDTSTGWEILQNSFKPYAACHLVHPAVDGARALGVAAADIRSAHATVSPLAMQVTGAASGRPATSLAAKFDLRYCIAMALDGRTLSAADFPEPWNVDAGTAAAAGRITAEASPDVGIAAARIEAVTNDGRTLKIDIPAAKGHPGNPMTWTDMQAKLNGLVEPVLGAARAAEVLGLARDFGAGRSLKRIGAMLGGARPE